MVYLQHWHGWCHMKQLPSQHVLCTPYNHAPCHFMQSHILKVHACVSKCSLYTFYNNPAPLNGSMQFHYCTDSNLGTRADDAFVLKRGVWRNTTWPSHSRPAIAASAHHFQICFLPEYFDRLFVYLLFMARFV